MTKQTHTASLPVYYGLQKVIRFLALFVFKQEVIGREHIPAEGSFLVVVNHLSLMDAPVVFMNCPRPLTGLIADNFRNVPGIGHLVRLTGGLWVARGEVDTNAIKACLRVLRNGGRLALAPEGTRSRVHHLLPGKTGAAYLADRTGVPIVPMAVTGTEKTSYYFKRLRRTPVRVVVGQPFHLPPDGHAKGQQLEEYTDQIMCRLAALLPPEYRGAYAEHPLLKQSPDA